jgi:hypothetical protein
MAHMHDLCKTLSSQDGAGLKHDGPMREARIGPVFLHTLSERAMRATGEI